MESRKVENWCMDSELLYGGFKKIKLKLKELFHFNKKLLK